jgi:hypothetical protein
LDDPYSRCIGRPDAARDFYASIAFDDSDVVLALQIVPELRAVAEVAAEADSRVGGDRAPAIQNVSNAAGRYADIERQPIGA